MKSPMSIPQMLVASLLLSVASPSLPADAAIDAAVANAERSAADRERDARDKPGEILALAGVKPGMTVADLFSAGGYYTELLAHLVGASGKVYAVNNVPYAQYSKKDRDARFTEGRLKNVEHRVIEAPAIERIADNITAEVMDVIAMYRHNHGGEE